MLGFFFFFKKFKHNFVLKLLFISWMIRIVKMNEYFL